MRQQVEQEMQRMNSARDTQLNNTQASVDVSVSQASLPAAFEPSMATLVSADFINLDIVEGRDATIEFTVENKSSQPWPFKPFV